MVRVFIDGASGTTGLEIRERLNGRADIALLSLDEAHRRDPEARAEALNAADVVILCLPDDAAREAVALITNPRTRVIDASTAHRTAPDWVYGLPELSGSQASAIAGTRFVSNPGCYPTGFLLLVAPLIRAGIVPVDWPMSVNAVSGYSGGGKPMIADFTKGGEGTAFRAYALGLAHKHVPEMQLYAGLAHPPIFAPAVVATYRGMVVEVPLPLHALPGRPTLAQVREVLGTAYGHAPTIRFGGDDAALIRVEDDAGTDRVTLHVCGDDAAGQARLIATLDNLGKGAAGAAVQNLNIMAGLDPCAGLIL